MAYFTPDSTSFDTTTVTQIVPTDYVSAAFVNAYYQKFINNDAFLKAGEDKLKHVTTVTLASASWTGVSAPYTQAVSVAGVTANDSGIPSLKYPNTVTDWDSKKAVDKEARYVYKCVTGAGTITFYSVEVPSIDLTFEIRGI